MTRADDLSGWWHAGGHRIDNAGLSINFERVDGAELWVEGLLYDDTPDGPTLGAWGLFRGPDDEELDGPKMFRGPDYADRALAWARETMESNQLHEPESWNDVYGGLDASGGDMHALGELVDSLGDYRPIDDFRQSYDRAEGCLDTAFEIVDSDNPYDPRGADDVVANIWAAKCAVSNMKAAPSAMLDAEIPDGVDAGAHETVGEYLDYVEGVLLSLHDDAEAWRDDPARRDCQ